MKKILILLTALILPLTGTAYEIPRLSPRPRNVAGVQSPIISLNGNWTFQTPSISASPIEVPGEWGMQGFNVPAGETATYSRKIEIPADWQDKRIKIRFDGLSSYGLVKVNGQTIGEHEGGMVPFELDITQAVKPGGGNNLTVEVRAGTVSDRLGSFSQYACHTVGGLLRKVTLFTLPETNIAGVDVVTKLDPAYRNAELNITTEITREITSESRLTVNYALIDHAGKTVASTKQPIEKTEEIKTRLAVKNAKLWNSEQPYLYTLRTTLLSDNKPIQVNEQRIGIRQIEVKGNLLYVNGKPVKLRGVNRHEVHPLRGRSLTPELCRQDAELFRAGNCNYIRTSHYPPSEEFLDACDEIGLFVESEAAMAWVQHGANPIWQKWDYKDPKFLPYMIRANFDNIQAHRHHPSVIMWSLANESLWSPSWERVHRFVKTLDPSRPTAFHDQCWGGYNNGGSTADIANYHYPGINGPAACDTMSRPTLFGEYAHLTCYNSRELVTDPGVRAAYGPHLVEMYDSMYYHPGCLGGAIWSGIDDTFHLPDGRIVGYGPWGPIDGWRREKPEYTGMKKAYTPFRIIAQEWSPDADELILTVENRYNFLDFGELLIEAGEQGKNLIPVQSRIPARSKGRIKIPVPGRISPIYVRVTEPGNRVCHEELFKRPNVDVVEIVKGTSELTVEDRNNLLAINWSNDATVLFDKTTGVISQAYRNNKTILQQGPVFCMVPMNADDGGKPVVAGETYQNDMHPLKNYPHVTVFAERFEYRQEENGDVTVEVDATYWNQDKGRITYRFEPFGKITMRYEITIAAEETHPRQYGLLIQVPRQMSKLSWERDGEFSHYPGYDIARTEGTALLNADKLYEVEAWGEEPTGAWKEDANTLGSVDFRSTKTRIRKVSLTDNNGKGITVYGNGRQASRSWLQDQSIHLLIADYSNAGSERFYGSPFTKDRITIKKGDVLKGELLFRL